MSRQFAIVAALAAGVVVSSSDRSHAGAIVDLSWHSGIGSVAGEIIVPPVDPGNDNVVGLSPNTMIIAQKAYFAIGAVDLVFDVVDSDGITEYAFHEGVSNSTTVDWSGYRLELGYGHSEDFVSALPGDPLNFDAPDFDSPFIFPGASSVMVFEHEVVVSGVFLASGAFWGGIIFHIDVPDGIDSFTVRQTPIPVPTPGAGALLALGAISLARRRR